MFSEACWKIHKFGVVISGLVKHRSGGLLIQEDIVFAVLCVLQAGDGWEGITGPSKVHVFHVSFILFLCFPQIWTCLYLGLMLAVGSQVTDEK